MTYQVLKESFQLFGLILQAESNPLSHLGGCANDSSPHDGSDILHQDPPMHLSHEGPRQGLLTLMCSNSLSVNTLTDWLMILSREELALCAVSSLPCESHCRQRSTRDLQETQESSTIRLLRRSRYEASWPAWVSACCGPGCIGMLLLLDHQHHQPEVGPSARLAEGLPHYVPHLPLQGLVQELHVLNLPPA
ncbi:hypothetical protein EYF80_013130 [Liparis tanakae]|uniref:Uncharacterized protein n=1 Tax=Liparis tanakae TaxID=230148 RepID=A0A4Z2IFD2_9TELE|nr:hypothetical protein EYF80_013130 [Liparis tanakae]